MPHILPCPVEHRVYAEGEPPRADGSDTRFQERSGGEDAVPGELGERSLQMAASEGRRRRECPIPRPRAR